MVISLAGTKDHIMSTERNRDVEVLSEAMIGSSISQSNQLVDDPIKGQVHSQLQKET